MAKRAENFPFQTLIMSKKADAKGILIWLCSLVYFCVRKQVLSAQGYPLCVRCSNEQQLWLRHVRTLPSQRREATHSFGLPTSGMSSATKRKHVTRDVVQNFTLPQDDETIVQVWTDLLVLATFIIDFAGSRSMFHCVTFSANEIGLCNILLIHYLWGCE